MKPMRSCALRGMDAALLLLPPAFQLRLRTYRCQACVSSVKLVKRWSLSLKYEGPTVVPCCEYLERPERRSLGL